MRLRNAFLPLLALVVTLAVPTLASADSTFVVVPLDDPGEGFFDETPVTPVPGNPGTTLGEQRLNAFQAAADVWGDILDSDVPIPIEAVMDPLFCDPGSAVLGAAGPTIVFRDFPGDVRPETWHTVALANSLSGVELTGTGEANMQAIFNSAIMGDPDCLGGLDWWYGDPAQRPGGTIPFVTVVEHELAHGLGFTTFYNRGTGEKLLGFDDTYLMNLEDHSTQRLWPQISDAERVASSTDEGDLHWVGRNVVNDSGALSAGRHPSGHVRMFAPGAFQQGSSVSHFDSILSPNELMEPILTPDATNFLTTQLLRDIGYRAATGAVEACVPGPTTLCIDDEPGDGRFRVEVDFNTTLGGGAAGSGNAISLEPLGVTQGGLFWFFAPTNPELLVKVINGCPVNDHYWVFYSAGTTVGFNLLVTDTQTGDTFLSANPDETPAPPVTDTSVFDCDDGMNGGM